MHILLVHLKDFVGGPFNTVEQGKEFVKISLTTMINGKGTTHYILEGAFVLIVILLQQRGLFAFSGKGDIVQFHLKGLFKGFFIYPNLFMAFLGVTLK